MKGTEDKPEQLTMVLLMRCVIQLPALCLGKQREMAQVLGPLQSRGKASWSSQLLASACSNPGCCATWGVYQQMKDLCFTLTFK